MPHGLINYIPVDTKAKCRYFKKLTCKGTLMKVVITVYRLEIQSVMLIWSTQLCELLPLFPSLWFNSLPSPFPVGVGISILYTRIQCVRGGGVWFSGTDIHPLQVNFLDDHILNCLLWVLSFYGVPPPLSPRFTNPRSEDRLSFPAIKLTVFSLFIYFSVQYFD